MKTDGDFADILGEKTPAIWKSNRPAKGGDTGAMFEKIIEQAEKLRAAKKPKATRASKTSKARPKKAS